MEAMRHCKSMDLKYEGSQNSFSWFANNFGEKQE